MGLENVEFVVEGEMISMPIQIITDFPLVWGVDILENVIIVMELVAIMKCVRMQLLI